MKSVQSMVTCAGIVMALSLAGWSNISQASQTDASLAEAVKPVTCQGGSAGANAQKASLSMEEGRLLSQFSGFDLMAEGSTDDVVEFHSLNYGFVALNPSETKLTVAVKFDASECAEKEGVVTCSGSYKLIGVGYVKDTIDDDAKPHRALARASFAKAVFTATGATLDLDLMSTQTANPYKFAVTCHQ